MMNNFAHFDAFEKNFEGGKINYIKHLNKSCPFTYLKNQSAQGEKEK